MMNKVLIVQQVEQIYFKWIGIADKNSVEMDFNTMYTPIKVILVMSPKAGSFPNAP